MSEPIARHQLFEYRQEQPFKILNVPASLRDAESLHSHWHEELEVAYIISGRSTHYIDGTCIVAEPGRLIVTNSGSVHSIKPGAPEDGDTEGLAAVVLVIHARFLEEHFPQYASLLFLNEKTQAREEVRDIMLRLSEWGRTDSHAPHRLLYAKGLVLQLLYYMCEEGVTDRAGAYDINCLKNIERIKGVIGYVETHYTEPISQSEVAQKFYFSREYFSRYFKKTCGMTFTEYVTLYRLGKAREDIVGSSAGILEIAHKNGFSDERRLINSFKKHFGTTPLQYRKAVKNTVRRPKDASSRSKNDNF